MQGYRGQKVSYFVAKGNCHKSPFPLQILMAMSNATEKFTEELYQDYSSSNSRPLAVQSQMQIWTASGRQSDAFPSTFRARGMTNFLKFWIFHAFFNFFIKIDVDGT